MGILVAMYHYRLWKKLFDMAREVQIRKILLGNLYIGLICIGWLNVPLVAK